MNGKMEPALARLHKRSISATDICSQFWCEKQMELNYLKPTQPTKEMVGGSRIHEKLKEAVYMKLDAEPVTYGDALYKQAYENYMSLLSLREKGVCRELKIYGSFNGYRISGQVDEIRNADNKSMIVERKTVKDNKAPNPSTSLLHRIQIMLYRKLLGDILEGSYTFDNFCNSYGIEKIRMSDQFTSALPSIGVREEFMGLTNIFRIMFREASSMQQLSDRLLISYMNRSDGKEATEVLIDYDRSFINGKLAHAMGYWNGEREASPVIEEEKWKCNFCRFFRNECTVWSADVSGGGGV
jgi:exonuclease V